jgi:putative flippase GtrA
MNVINIEFLKFIIVGIINTINYYVIYLLFLSILEINYMVAHIFGFISSLIISFFLNSYYTYKVKPTILKFLKFPLTQIFNIGVTSFIMYFLVEQLHLDHTIAPILSIFITVPLTFILTGRILKN